MWFTLLFGLQSSVTPRRKTKTLEIHANWPVFFEALHTARGHAAHTVPCLHSTFFMPVTCSNIFNHVIHTHTLTHVVGEVSTGRKIEITDQKLCSIPTFCDIQRNFTWWWFWDTSLVCNVQKATLRNKGYANKVFLYLSFVIPQEMMMHLLATRQLLTSSQLSQTLNWNCMWWGAKCCTHSSGLSLLGLLLMAICQISGTEIP